MAVICFDLWNTLVASIVGASYEDVLVAGGVERKDIYPFVRKEIMTQSIGYDEAAKMLADRFRMPKTVAGEIADLWRSDNEGVLWISGAEKMLCDLHRRHRLVLVSNLTRPGWEKVERRLHISRYFDHLYLSWQQGVSKPDPKVWQTVQGWYPDAQEFWMVGDSLEDDLLVPQRIGWNILRVENHQLDLPRKQLSLVKLTRRDHG